MDNSAKVISVLKKNGEPMRPGDIAANAGLEQKDVTRILADLKKEGKVISPKRCFYSLP